MKVHGQYFLVFSLGKLNWFWNSCAKRHLQQEEDIDWVQHFYKLTYLRHFEPIHILKWSYTSVFILLLHLKKSYKRHILVEGSHYLVKICLKEVSDSLQDALDIIWHFYFLECHIFKYTIYTLYSWFIRFLTQFFTKV